MEDGHENINRGTIAAGPGKLITIVGTIKTTTTVTTPIGLGDGNHVLLDNQTNAVITSGNGNNRITEIGTGATITAGNGNNDITDLTGGAIVTTGTGDAFINPGGVGNTIKVGPTSGGTHDVTFINAGSGTATVNAGNGNMGFSDAKVRKTTSDLTESQWDRAVSLFSVPHLAALLLGRFREAGVHSNWERSARAVVLARRLNSAFGWCSEAACSPSRRQNTRPWQIRCLRSQAGKPSASPVALRTFA